MHPLVSGVRVVGCRFVKLSSRVLAMSWCVTFGFGLMYGWGRPLYVFFLLECLGWHLTKSFQLKIVHVVEGSVSWKVIEESCIPWSLREYESMLSLFSNISICKNESDMRSRKLCPSENSFFESFYMALEAS